ncbi:MAG TPA: tRNA adenosine(34) deaminase TadA [Polyangiaceae bacterium]|nr:tRNA adenosine(34) deaminase TadA [Polyangiaceae bacterium]
MSEPQSPEDFMRLALEEADLAVAHGDVPVGAVVVSAAGVVLARNHNRREEHADPTAHAELLAIRDATRGLPGWRLEGATVYVTLEPCAMCAGAMVNARIAKLVFAASDPKAGAVVSLYQIGTDTRLNHRFEIEAGFMADEGARRLSQFFSELRKKRLAPSSS